MEDARVALDRSAIVGESRTTSSKSGSTAIPGAAIRLASPTRKRRNGGGSSLLLEPEYEDVDSIGDGAFELLEKWDAKSRDEMLRSMEDFRPCPHCSGGGSSGREPVCTGSAGGFVTPECLAPINEERERHAELLLSMAGNPSSMGIVLSYSVYFLYCTGRSTESDRSRAVFQVLSAVLPSMLVPILPHALRLLFATAARREILRPIRVSCPCCLADFNLEASSELRPGDEDASDAVAESSSRLWKESNTRPCPGCASPIMKDGGCNHVKCGRCRVDFCWACMRVRTSCRGYQCTNGAPFGNAFGDGTIFAVRAGLDSLERERQAGQTLIERIDRVEVLAGQNLSVLPFPYASIVGIIFATILSNSSSAILWNCIRRVLSLVSSLFCPYVFFFFSLLLVLPTSFSNAPRWRINVARWPGSYETRHNAAGIGIGGNYDGTHEFIRAIAT